VFRDAMHDDQARLRAARHDLKPWKARPDHAPISAVE
jgi:hypothetical protein